MRGRNAPYRQAISWCATDLIANPRDFRRMSYKQAYHFMTRRSAWAANAKSD